MSKEDGELFKLSKEVWVNTGWVNTGFQFTSIDGLNWSNPLPISSFAGATMVAYTSDYLLEKLGNLDNEITLSRCHHQNGSRNWCAEGDDPGSEYINIFAYADTPLKALLKLTLALHDAGQLK